MKNMRAIFMYVYFVYGFGVNISADMRAFIDNEAFRALFFCFQRKNASKKPRANYKIIERRTLSFL
jgi:hypothetical protein